MTEGRAAFLRVGLLILAGGALLVAFVWFLGGSRLGKGTLYESYFSESVQGLEVGVAVRYRGVAVGQVTEIGLVTAEYGAGAEVRLDQATYRLVFVRYRVDQKRVGRVPDTPTAVNLGLRARLASAGLTGVTYIELDFENPARHPVAELPWTPLGDYIPSVPTTLSRVEDATKSLIERMSQIDIVGVVMTARQVLDDTDRLVRTAEQHLRAADIGGLTTDLKRTSAALRGAVENPDIARLLAGTAAASQKLTEAIAQIPPLTARMPPLIAAVESVARRADGGLADTQQALAPILRDLAAATANLREVTEALRRDPAQVLTGQPPRRQTEGGR